MKEEVRGSVRVFDTKIGLIQGTDEPFWRLGVKVGLG